MYEWEKRNALEEGEKRMKKGVREGGIEKVNYVWCERRRNKVCEMCWSERGRQRERTLSIKREKKKER